jgi:hypothetical protein
MGCSYNVLFIKLSDVVEGTYIICLDFTTIVCLFDGV